MAMRALRAAARFGWVVLIWGACSMRVLLAAFFSMVPCLAFAAWNTLIDDDIFSGGKTALMVGEIDPGSSLAIDCKSSGEISIAYIEKSSSDDNDEGAAFRLLIKIDDQPTIEFSGRLERRNEKYIEITSSDRDLAIQAVKEIASARRKILVGVSRLDGDSKHSASAGAAGSSKAAAKLVKACNIQ